MPFTISTKDCFINAPFQELKDGLIDLFIEHKLQPEIGLEGNALYDQNIDDFTRIASTLKKNGLACTLHAPFFDLSPGALDPHIRQVSRDKLNLAFALIDVFKPLAIVCHLSFEDNKHGYKLEEWHSHATQTWQDLTTLAAARKTTVMLENTYEKNPVQHKRILQTINSEYARFCLDVGHLLSFSKSTWQQWLPIMSPWLGHLHLHDNNGDRDTHLGISKGDFDFTGLFAFLSENNLNPSITLEPHTEEDLWVSLDTLAEMGVVDLRI